MAIARGTTPIHIFNTDVDLSNAVAIYVTYKQANTVVAEKSIDEMTVTPETITLNLTQEDTLNFLPMRNVLIQIRAKFQDGTAIKSKTISTSVEDVLKEGVI